MVFFPEASLGYALLENNRFKVSPFIGIGSMDIGATMKDSENIPELKEISLDFTTTYVFGINFDLKFGKRKIPAFIPKTSYIFLRLRYAYNTPQFEKKILEWMVICII